MKILALVLILFLVACTDPERVVVTVTEPRLIEVPSAMLDQCPPVPAVPSERAEGYTEAQVSQYIIALHGTASRCSATVESIRDFMTKAKAEPGK